MLINDISAAGSLVSVHSAASIRLSSSTLYLVLAISVAIVSLILLISYYSLKVRNLKKALAEYEANTDKAGIFRRSDRNESVNDSDNDIDKYYNSHEFLSVLCHSLKDGIAFYDRNSSLKYANPAFYTLTGIKEGSHSDSDFMAILHPENNDFLMRREEELKSEGFFECDIRIRHAEGNYPVLSTRSLIVKDASGNSIGSLIVMRDITTLKKGMEEMLRTNIESEAGNRLKAGFLANISHEIRTPLNSVVGFANLLLDDNLPRETREEYVEHINFNSEKLLQIIGDIIDLSRLSSSQIEITYEEASLSGLIKEVVDESRIIIHRTDKPIILNVRNNTTSANDLVFTDRIWLKRVLSHLMDNAIKFTLDGSIELVYGVENSDITFSVKDTGIGINKENLDRIFEEFSQEVGGHHRPFEGLGVGLTLAKEVVERMGGKIQVRSEKGIGSEFSFSVPYRPAGMKSKSFRHEEDNVLTTINWQKRKCLLVDDNKDVLIYLNRILVDTGITILTARSGFEAIEIIKADDSIDLVILDMQMPEMNGIEATREIKKLRSKLPIIAQTAFVFENDTDIILEAGCDACLIKPIRREHLITVMSSFIRSSPHL